jgi:hypothetical protein
MRHIVFNILHPRMFWPSSLPVPVSLPPTTNDACGIVTPPSAKFRARADDAELSPFPPPRRRNVTGYGSMLRPNSIAVPRDRVL